MVIRTRDALGRQNDRKAKRETSPQTIEQAMLRVLMGLRGGCYRTDCILQEFRRDGIRASPEQIADAFNSLIVAKKIRLLRIKPSPNGAAVYFTVLSPKIEKIKR